MEISMKARAQPEEPVKTQQSTIRNSIQTELLGLPQMNEISSAMFLDSM